MGLSAPWEAVVERTKMVGCSKCICETWFCVWFLPLPKIHVTFPSLSSPNSPKTVSSWVSLKSEQSHYSPFTILRDWHRFEHHHGVGLQKQRGGEWHHRATTGQLCWAVLCCSPVWGALWDITQTAPALGQRGTWSEKRPSCTETFISNCRVSHSTSLFLHTDLNHSAHFRCSFHSFALEFWLWFILYI